MNPTEATEHDVGEKVTPFVYEGLTPGSAWSLILSFTPSKHIPNHDEIH